MATVNIVEYGLSLRLLEGYTLVDQVRPLAVIADLLYWWRASSTLRHGAILHPASVSPDVCLVP